MIRWLKNRWLDWFGTPIREGTVIKKVAYPAKPFSTIIVGGLPVVGPAVPGSQTITFEKDGRRRTVDVSADCWRRYDLGDHISFDN